MSKYVYEVMNWDEDELYQLLSIVHELDCDSFCEESDYIEAMSKLYDLIEGYYGYRTEFDEFIYDEDGELIPHTVKEYNEFVKRIYKEMLKIFIRKTDAGEEIFNEGSMYGYNGREEIADLIEDVTTLR